jgi:hypothetical protein
VTRLVKIREMVGLEEGALFLLRRANRIPADALLEAASETDRAGAEGIATQPACLPLVLDQAGAYIEATGCRPSGYLARYQISHAGTDYGFILTKLDQHLTLPTVGPVR